jgi:cytochrome c biogenesis protein CcdA
MSSRKQKFLWFVGGVAFTLVTLGIVATYIGNSVQATFEDVRNTESFKKLQK